MCLFACCSTHVRHTGRQVSLLMCMPVRMLLSAHMSCVYAYTRLSSPLRTKKIDRMSSPVNFSMHMKCLTQRIWRLCACMHGKHQDPSCMTCTSVLHALGQLYRRSHAKLHTNECIICACVMHAGHVDLRHRRCERDGCMRQPSFASGPKTATRCRYPSPACA